MTPNRRLRRDEASAYLFEKHGIEHKPGTLAKLAVTGGGPAFRKAGRYPIYEPDDLDAYAATKVSEKATSTSQLRSGAERRAGRAA